MRIKSEEGVGKVDHCDRRKKVRHILDDVKNNFVKYGCSINEVNLQKLNEYLTSKILVNMDSSQAKEQGNYRDKDYPYNNLILRSSSDYSPPQKHYHYNRIHIHR